MPPINSIAQQIRLINQWLPLLSFGQRWLSETDVAKRIEIAADASEWLTSKTENTLDDELVVLFFNMLATDDGEKFVRRLVSIGEAAAAAEGVR